MNIDMDIASLVTKAKENYIQKQEEEAGIQLKKQIEQRQALITEKFHAIILLFETVKNEFNKQYGSQKILVKQSDKMVEASYDSYKLIANLNMLPFNKNLYIEKLNGTLIAWGVIKENKSNTGYNIVLVNKGAENNVWMFLKNISSVFMKVSKPESVIFTNEDDLLKRLSNIDTMDIYETAILDFNEKLIIELFSAMIL